MLEVAQPVEYLLDSRSVNTGQLDLFGSSSVGMDDVDKLLEAFRPGQGGFDLPGDLAMDWNVPLPDGVAISASLTAASMPLVASTPLPVGGTGTPQPFAGPVSRLGWSSQSPMPIAPVLSSPVASAGPNAFAASDLGSPHVSSPHLSSPLSVHGAAEASAKPAFPAIPRSARRASVPATAPGGANGFIGGGGLWETRSTPPLWSIGEGDAAEGPVPGSMRPALSADANEIGNISKGGGQEAATASSTGRRLRPSVRSASVGANSERPLSSADLDLGLSGSKAKERNRRAQKRFRERQKVKQMEAVQRVVQLEEALDRLEMERSELSLKLKQYSRKGPPPGGDAGGGPSDARTQDSGSEQQMQSQQTTPTAERVLTLSVPQGQERHLIGSDIKKLSWNEYIQLYENYLEEMAAMLLQAQGDGASPAGHRLQRLCTELITVTAAMLMHDPTTKGRLHCMPLMSQQAATPLAPPDSHFWHRVTMALCLTPQQRHNCLRLRNAHLHKVRDIMQDRFRINAMMQTTLPSYDFELQAARQHLRALAVSENLQRNLRQEQGLQLELSTTFFSQALTPIQMATAATESYPWWPDILAMLNAACEGVE